MSMFLVAYRTASTTGRIQVKTSTLAGISTPGAVQRVLKDFACNHFGIQFYFDCTWGVYELQN